MRWSPRGSRRRVVLFALVPACALPIAGCDFPEVAFTGGTSGAGNAGGVWDPGGAGGEDATTAPASAVASSTGQGGDGGESGAGGASRASSTSGAGAAGGTGAASGTGAAGGAGGASGDGGAGGDGGSAESGATTSGTGGDGQGATTSSGGPRCPIDDDRDGYVSRECEGGTDCDDGDERVHPQQSSTFYDEPRPGGGYDWDCSGKSEPEIEAIECDGLLVCTAKMNVFLADVPCGQAGPFGDCDGLCKSKIKQPAKVRTCH